MEKLILLKRNNPVEYEIHRGEIRQASNLLLTTKDKAFAERLVNSFNDCPTQINCKHCGNKDWSETGICGKCFKIENGLK